VARRRGRSRRHGRSKAGGYGASACDENDPVMKARISAFTQALAGLGWTVGRNVRMDLRWGRADINRVRALARELVGLQSDIMSVVCCRSFVVMLHDSRLIQK
jgi:hypothetical protein